MTINIFLGILIGALVWQTVVVIAVAITDDEDIYCPIAIGVWCGILWVAGRIYQKIQMLKSRKYNLYQFYAVPRGPHLNMEPHGWVCNLFMTPEFAKKFRQAGEYDTYYIKLLRTGSQFKSPVWKSDILDEKHMNRLGSPDYVKNFLVGEG